MNTINKRNLVTVRIQCRYLEKITPKPLDAEYLSMSVEWPEILMISEPIKFPKRCILLPYTQPTTDLPQFEKWNAVSDRLECIWFYQTYICRPLFTWFRSSVHNDLTLNGRYWSDRMSIAVWTIARTVFKREFLNLKSYIIKFEFKFMTRKLYYYNWLCECAALIKHYFLPIDTQSWAFVWSTQMYGLSGIQNEKKC